MKRSKKKWLILAVCVALLAIIAAVVLNVLRNDPTLDMADVYSMINTIVPYLVPFVVIGLAAMIIGTVLEAKFDKKKMFLFNCEAALVSVLVLIITVNAICVGPMSTLITQLFPDTKGISEETLAESSALAEEMANQGTVLLKNDNSFLPIDITALNVFGWASTNPCYGGTGSGSIDPETCVTLLQGLTNAGIQYNTELEEFYVNYRADRPEVGMWSQDWTLPEPVAGTYTTDLLNSAKEFSDTALIVITRVGGEGADVPTDVSKVTYEGNPGDFPAGEHYLQLSKTEREMVELVTSNFENVIVLYNGSNAMELDWVDEYSQIKSTIWLPSPGQEGFNALGKIITGELNPSGKTVDTFVKDLTKTPTWNNFGTFEYDNAEGYHFVNYVEGIYVGYRYYETYFLNNEEGYNNAVQYPFGHGLSYTTFEQTMGELVADGTGNYSVDVTVTNTGSVAGMDVVQIYQTAPYYEGGIEKSAVALVDFEKTEMLEPGASETITITFNEEDLASYDTYGEGAYVLDAGIYEIKLMKNSHEVIDSKTFEVASKIVYNEENKRSSDLEVATNTFEDFTSGELTYLSRANNFENHDVVLAAPTSYSMNADSLATVTNHETYVIENDENDVMPTVGVNNGIELFELRGKEYDDELWDSLLDQLTVEEMKNLIGLGGYQTIAIESVKKLATVDADGPAGYSSFFNETIKGTPFPGATMIAATWNKELAYQRGVSMAKEADGINVSGWYAPAMNIHRSAFAGRNFEYYSEDPIMSGYMAAEEVRGAQENGLYAYIKHFALNDQEEQRTGLLCTWANEQTIREIYLKPFEDAVKDGGATAVMSSFNYIGNEWAGGCSELLNDVLRGEWGFRGMVLTDYFGGYGYMDADKAIRNGNDIMLSPSGHEFGWLDDTTSATAVSAMRTSSKNIMYTVVNSRAYEDYTGGIQLTGWMKVVIGIDVALAIILIGLQVLAI
ncbi:MAG: glycoside hydrolase family 3 protein, partial [Lachnospiraceae bacterium]